MTQLYSYSKDKSIHYRKKTNMQKLVLENVVMEEILTPDQEAKYQ